MNEIESNDRIERLISDGQRDRNWVFLLQARFAIVQNADAMVKAAAAEGRGFTVDEQNQVRSLLERAESLQREVSDRRVQFEKEVRQAHPVSRSQF